MQEKEDLEVKEEKISLNFLERIIEDDLANGRVPEIGRAHV